MLLPSDMLQRYQNDIRHSVSLSAANLPDNLLSHFMFIN